jgi:hypothetical protein
VVVDRLHSENVTAARELCREIAPDRGESWG